MRDKPEERGLEGQAVIHSETDHRQASEGSRVSGAGHEGRDEGGQGLAAEGAGNREGLAECAFPKDGILWRSYEDTITLIKEKTRPILVFVMDYDGTCWPFLREIFKEIPKNEKLRNLLNGPCIAMLLEVESMPKNMAEMGAGSYYHIAILAPSGLNPLAIFQYVTGEPEALVEQIAKALEVIAPLWA